jgi:hypothetical protein
MSRTLSRIAGTLMTSFIQLARSMGLPALPPRSESTGYGNVKAEIVIELIMSAMSLYIYTL